MSLIILPSLRAHSDWVPDSPQSAKPFGPSNAAARMPGYAGTDLYVRVIGAEHGNAFGKTVATAFGFSDAMIPAP